MKILPPPHKFIQLPREIFQDIWYSVKCVIKSLDILKLENSNHYTRNENLLQAISSLLHVKIFSTTGLKP